MMDFVQRRARFLRLLERPTVLFAGGLVPRNYPANTYPYRADSTFLFFFERPEPGSAALFDPADGTVQLFLPRRTLDDALWSGPLEPFEAAAERHGVHGILPVDTLEAEVARRAAGRPVDALAVADPVSTARARALTAQPLEFRVGAVGRRPLLEALATLRLRKDPSELSEIALAAAVTAEAHDAVLRAARPGVTEQALAALVEGTFVRGGCTGAYGTILSARGEVLHNHAHHGTLRAGDLLLVDAGAERLATGYCADVTRTWPVGGFSPEARDVYDAVLAAQEAAIAGVRPGVRFRDLHLLASRVLAEHLVAMGLLRGEVQGLVEQGAHAVFFPHGLGHQLGLDVHDVEAFGDDILYPHGRQRSAQFGLCFLRMDMDLEAGMTFTVEPGLYFSPSIVADPALRERLGGAVDWARAERFTALNGGRGLGGVRIEDDVQCTTTGPQVLTGAIPKQRADVERLTGVG